MTRLRPAYEVIPGVAVGMSGGVPRIAHRIHGKWKGARRYPKRGLLITRNAIRITSDRLALGPPRTLWVGIYLALVAYRSPPNWAEVIRALGVPNALQIAQGVRPDEMEPVYQFFGRLPRGALLGCLSHKDPRLRAAAVMALGSAVEP